MRTSATRVSTYAAPSTSEEGLTEASLRQTVSRFFLRRARWPARWRVEIVRVLDLESQRRQERE